MGFIPRAQKKGLYHHMNEQQLTAPSAYTYLAYQFARTKAMSVLFDFSISHVAQPEGGSRRSSSCPSGEESIPQAQTSCPSSGGTAGQTYYW